jgi:hypothetical protein
VFKFSGVKSLLVGGGDESVILSADGVVDAVFSDVGLVDGVDGESAVFDFDLYVKSLGRPIGGVSDFDGDGDGMVAGPDGEDNVPAPVKKVLSVAEVAKALPALFGVKSEPWAAGDEDMYNDLVEEGVSEKSARLAVSESVTLGDYGYPAVAAGNCGVASSDLAAALIRAGVVEEGEVFLREVGEPRFGGEGGGSTHYVTHIGPKDSPDAVIVDLTLRQFDPDADFPWVGTVEEYREQGYETDEFKGPELGDSMDPVDASGKVSWGS